MPTKVPFLGNLYKLTCLSLCTVALASCSLKYKTRTRPKNYFTGFIVKFTGDTLEGKVKLQNDFKNKVWYITDGSKKKKYIFPEDVKYMQITSLRFKNVIVNGKDRLIEQVAFGKYNLYGYTRSIPDRGNVFYYYVELEENKELTRINQDNYQEIFRLTVFQDPYIMQRVESGQWTYDDMVQIFRVYNAKNSD